jgi:hypothetical protein
MSYVVKGLGRKSRYGTFDTVIDAFYVYDSFEQAGGFAAVPFNVGRHGGVRQFSADGRPLCAAGLAMPQLLTYLDRTSGLVAHQREKCGRSLLHPTPTSVVCPIADPHFEKGGCTTTIVTSKGAHPPSA